MRKVFIIMLLLAPTLAFAQADRIEITPSFGYRWGGEIRAKDSTLLTHDVSVDPSDTYGLSLAFPINEHVSIELLHNRQHTRLEKDNGLFVPNTESYKVDIDYTHVGMIFQWPTRSWTPYVATSIGVGRIDAEIPTARVENRFSAGLGFGFKLDFSDHVGFRLEHRSFYTQLRDWENNDDNHDHHNRGCHDNCNRGLTQGQVMAGVFFRF